MSEAVREMTMEELIAEKAKQEEQCRVLANRCDMKERQIKEMQSHIDCLKAELAEVQMNKQEFPAEPIKVADMLIDEFTSVSEDYVRAAIKNNYPVDDTAFCDMRKREIRLLRQIRMLCLCTVITRR